MAIYVKHGWQTESKNRYNGVPPDKTVEVIEGNWSEIRHVTHLTQESLIKSDES